MIEPCNRTKYEYDPETGLSYAFARYYSPRLGRFLSTDPLGGSVGNLQSHNAYAYTLNNPMNLVDPSGLGPCNFINSHAWLGAPNPAAICNPVSNFGDLFMGLMSFWGTPCWEEGCLNFLLSPGVVGFNWFGGVSPANPCGP